MEKIRFIYNWELFKESKNSKSYNPKNLIHEICTCMVLLNNEFLDNILDRGLKARYSENSNIFLTDLKNLLLSSNRLKIGKWQDDKFTIDSDSSNIRGIFESVEFDIEKDWDKLVNSRNTARNIIDKLLPDEKLKPERIKSIYWIGPNKNDEIIEDIVIETTDGIQYSFILNKNISLQRSASFNTFADDLIPNDIDKLFSEENIHKWNKLTQEWIRIIYECSNKNMQLNIEKFINAQSIQNIGYFQYFDIRHRDPRFKHLGEYFKEFEKNILKFSDLMIEIWKNKDSCLVDVVRADKEWREAKTVILNSKILEHLFTTSLKEHKMDEIQKLDDGYKRAIGTVKMKLIKTVVNKLGCLERPVYYLSSSGNDFHQLPSRTFFRDYYDDIDVQFDYHVKFTEKTDDINDLNDFNIKIKLLTREKELLKMNILVGFGRSEFSGKLSAKYKFHLPDNFNYLISSFGKDIEEY